MMWFELYLGVFVFIVLLYDVDVLVFDVIVMFCEVEGLMVVVDE